ncbi:hypothetical protein CDO73_00295 [Saccharibacillus sp. O23]|uniref:S-layer homology domain-containing protein n=1 Tax=Saccharibacillus sp. O23 TaxID=2009338 RepID=UPI000B4E35D1|nr:S-layer homology domain-containing protein [Saccharibacillus sp. O23]OWR32984.1 hypothetical protein CDO73_00295 [Saccharibacillus sp. O23]
MRFSKKMMASLLAATSIISPLSVSADTTSAATPAFNDLDQASAWSRDSILQAKLLGLFEGDAQGNFRPGDQITRQEMAKILVQLLNLPLETAADSSFSDVDSKAWSAAYIEAALKAGIMQGYGNGKFDPQAVMTREQLAIVIVKALELPLENDTTSLNRFDDAATIHDWSARYVAAALKAGLMTGSGSTFGATATANRQEAAMVAVRVHTQKQQAAQTSSGDGTSTAPGTPTSTGTSTVQGTVVPNGTKTPPAVTPANPAPASGGGSTTPVTPPVTMPVTPPAEKSLPAVAVSRTVNVLDYHDLFNEPASVISKPISAADLDFSIDKAPASATSKSLTNLDFSVQGTKAKLTSLPITDFNFSGSDYLEFSLTYGSSSAYVLLDHQVSGSEGLINFINTQFQSEDSPPLIDVTFDSENHTLSLTAKDFDPGKTIKLSGPKVSQFFSSSQSTTTVTANNTKTFTVNDGSSTATITLNQAFNSTNDLVQEINRQLILTQVDAQAALGSDTTTFTVTRKSLDHEGKLFFGGTNVGDFLAETTYTPSIVTDRSSKIEIELADGHLATIYFTQKYANIEEFALALTLALNAREMNMNVVTNRYENKIELRTNELGAAQKIRITENSDPRFFAQGQYFGQDQKAQNKSFRVDDGTFSTTVKLNWIYEDIQQLTSAINTQLERGKARAVAELNSPYTFKIVSRTTGSQSKLKIDGADADLFFDQKLSEGSGPQVDQAPMISGVPVKALADQFFSDSSLTPLSTDTDIASVKLMRSTQTGLDYTANSYSYPVEGYTLGSEISAEGSYQLTVEDRAGQKTVTYFSIEKTWPAILSVTQQQNSDGASDPYKYDAGDKLTFTLNNFVWKYDSQDQLNKPLTNVDLFMLPNLEAALTRNPSNASYTFGTGATLTTEEVMPYHPAYGRKFTLTLGEGANIPSTGFYLIPFTSDLISPSGLRPSFSSQAYIPALVE